MSTRPFQLPQDIELMNSLVIDGFNYPDNPEWSVQEDEIQGMIDRVNGARRIWPILTILRLFVPLFRDILCGFIEEVDGKPVGLINYMRQRNVPEWYIANVTVLPNYRRRGIARQLVEATLRELRRRNATAAFLDVVAGNDPAFNLYKELGFDPFRQSTEYFFQGDEPIASEPLPQGYRLKTLSRFDWRTLFIFSKRVTPAHVTKYEPVTEERFRVPFTMPLFGTLFESAGGFRSQRFAIYTSGGEVVGIGQYTYRTRQGGTNSARITIDPAHADLADFMLSHVLSTIQRVSPGRRIEFTLEDWESALMQCAADMGCKKRFGSHHMGLRF